MKNRKYPPWIATFLWVAVIGLTAYFTGQFASIMVQNRLQVPRTMVLAKQKIEVKETEKPLGFYQNQILPALGEEKKTPGPDGAVKTPGNPEGSPDADGNPPPINWDQLLSAEEPAVSLSGTIIGGDAAIAFFSVNGKAVSVSIGEMVGSYKVSAIDKNTVTFVRGSQTKTVSMTLGEVKEVIPVANMSTNTRPVAIPSEEPDMKDMISFQGSTRVIDRRKFNALLKPPSRLANELKFIPNSKDDKPYGIKISYLKPGSFFSQIGMRSGDILIKTNQKELQSVEDSFYAYQAFRNEDHLTMEVDRDGTIIQIPMEFR